MGTHPKVCALLGGIFNNRPPKPRYTFIWDVDKVLLYLRSLDSKNLSDKLLRVKLVMLLSLTAASRCSELVNLDVRYMTRSESTYTFHFAKLFKSWRKGKAPPAIVFHKYSSD